MCAFFFTNPQTIIEGFSIILGEQSADLKLFFLLKNAIYFSKKGHFENSKVSTIRLISCLFLYCYKNIGSSVKPRFLGSKKRLPSSYNFK